MELTIISGAWLFPFEQEGQLPNGEKFYRTIWINLYDISLIRFGEDNDGNPTAIIKMKDNAAQYSLHGDNYAKLLEDLEYIREKQFYGNEIVVL